jgi:hypothetical protein
MLIRPLLATESLSSSQHVIAARSIVNLPVMSSSSTQPVIKVDERASGLSLTIVMHESEELCRISYLADREMFN